MSWSYMWVFILFNWTINDNLFSVFAEFRRSIIDNEGKFEDIWRYFHNTFYFFHICSIRNERWLASLFHSSIIQSKQKIEISSHCITNYGRVSLWQTLNFSWLYAETYFSCYFHSQQAIFRWVTRYVNIDSRAHVIFSSLLPYYLRWVRDHRLHHKCVDTDADPYSPARGIFFSHIGWVFVYKHPDVIKQGNTIDMSDMENDPVLMFQMKWD